MAYMQADYSTVKICSCVRVACRYAILVRLTAVYCGVMATDSCLCMNELCVSAHALVGECIVNLFNYHHLNILIVSRWGI